MSTWAKPSGRSKSSGAKRTSPILVVSDDESYDGPSSGAMFNLGRGAGSIKGKERATNGYGPENGHLEVDPGGKEAIRVALAKLDSEIADIEAQLQPLQDLHTSLTAERADLESQLSRYTTQHLSKSSSSKPTKSSDKIDYQDSNFPWSNSISAVLRATFGLPSFRLCQEGVINAAMDGRDIVCVMPTGGGKSLTYQLPAVIGGKGVTVVISPLIALIWDQVRALKELGVECVAMTGSTSKEEQNEIYRRLENGGSQGKKEIRLCYVTPEKVAKSKRLVSALEKANSAGRLTRFVIDEAHCCSQLGHDFRPDYKKLSVLKQFFPRIPIQAVTATLSTKTLPDLLQILRLPPICDGRAANSTGTIFFSAPLYRPNLHYKVLTKPSSAKAAIEKMGKWIQEFHPGKSGIIYCLSKKDAETVADALREWSNGSIKTGVYHAGIDEWEKEKIHVDWRKGKVNVICATIAFGLGIDKGDVRYVIHHSMSKSLDGYYQETGRAGRDGQDSDCVLLYRGQDASRLTSLIYGDTDGGSKLREMVRFAQDLKTCRKIAFAKYFSTSANLSANAWDKSTSFESDTKRGGEITTCGQCDNCTRSTESILTKDVTLDSWKIFKVLETVERDGGRVTMSALGDLVRGLGGGSFGTMQKEGGRKRAVRGEGTLDVGSLVGGKVELSKDDTESLIIQLTLENYLTETYAATAYSVNVYLKPSAKSVRISRHTETEIRNGQTHRIECTFLNTKALGRATAKKKGKKELVKLSEELEDEEDEEKNKDSHLSENGFSDEDGDIKPAKKPRAAASKTASNESKFKSKSKTATSKKSKIEFKQPTSREIISSSEEDIPENDDNEEEYDSGVDEIRKAIADAEVEDEDEEESETSFDIGEKQGVWRVNSSVKPAKTGPQRSVTTIAPKSRNGVGKLANGGDGGGTRRVGADGQLYINGRSFLEALDGV